MTFGINEFIAVGFLFVALVGLSLLINSIMKRNNLSKEDGDNIKEAFRNMKRQKLRNEGATEKEISRMVKTPKKNDFDFLRFLRPKRKNISDRIKERKERK